MISDKVLLTIYRFPKIYGLFRILLTVILIFENFLDLPFAPLQVLAIIGYGIALINYQLFKNDVPIMSIFLPNITYYLIAAILTKTVFITSFIPLAFIDVSFILILWVKSIKWPFYI